MGHDKNSVNSKFTLEKNESFPLPSWNVSDELVDAAKKRVKARLERSLDEIKSRHVVRGIFIPVPVFASLLLISVIGFGLIIGMALGLNSSGLSSSGDVMAVSVSGSKDNLEKILSQSDSEDVVIELPSIDTSNIEGQPVFMRASGGN